jgi:hypothetical protein
MYFRCYAYAVHGDRFVAECLDLDITVEENTLNKAVRSLNNAIEGYVTVALEGDVHGLIPRPSPLSHRLLYHYRVFVYGLLARLFPRNQPRKLRRFEVERPSLCY